jgi:hypothetical protein
MPQRRDEVDTSCLEQLGTRRVTVGALETSTPRTENVGGLDDVALNLPGTPTISRTRRCPAPAQATCTTMSTLAATVGTTRGLASSPPATVRSWAEVRG